VPRGAVLSSPAVRLSPRAGEGCVRRGWGGAAALGPGQGGEPDPGEPFSLGTGNMEFRDSQAVGMCSCFNCEAVVIKCCRKSSPSVKTVQNRGKNCTVDKALFD